MDSGFALSATTMTPNRMIRRCGIYQKDFCQSVASHARFLFRVSVSPFAAHDSISLLFYIIVIIIILLCIIIAHLMLAARDASDTLRTPIRSALRTVKWAREKCEWRSHGWHEAWLFDCWYALFTESDQRECACASEWMSVWRAHTAHSHTYGNWWREWCAHLSAFIILLDTFYCIAFVSFSVFFFFFSSLLFIILFRCFTAFLVSHTHCAHSDTTDIGPRRMVTINRISSTFQFSPWMSNERQTVLETIYM